MELSFISTDTSSRSNSRNPATPLIAKDDVILRASVRTLSGALVRPHGDWDSRKIHIYGELMIGDRVLERLQMFYSGERATFEAPFFVPLPNDAPDGIILRVIAADSAGGNFGMSQAKYPVLSERLRPHPEKRSPLIRKVSGTLAASSRTCDTIVYDHSCLL